MKVDNRCDYSNSFVIVVTREVTERQLDLIYPTDVWQNENTIFVRALFISGLESPEYHGTQFLPYAFVQVKKGEMTRYGKIKFILIDDYGIERASTNAYISPPENEG